MNGEVIGFISLGALIIVDIVLVAYWAGSLKTEVQYLRDRVGKLEDRPTPLCEQHIAMDGRIREVEIRDGAK